MSAVNAIGQEDLNVKRKNPWDAWQNYQMNSQGQKTKEIDNIGAYLSGAMQPAAYMH